MGEFGGIGVLVLFHYSTYMFQRVAMETGRVWLRPLRRLAVPCPAVLQLPCYSLSRVQTLSVHECQDQRRPAVV